MKKIKSYFLKKLSILLEKYKCEHKSCFNLYYKEYYCYKIGEYRVIHTATCFECNKFIHQSDMNDYGKNKEDYIKYLKLTYKVLNFIEKDN